MPPPPEGSPTDCHQAGWSRSGFGALRTAWLAARGLLTRMLGKARVDRVLWSLGFFSAKSRWFRFAACTADGHRVFLRPEDQAVLDEVHTDRIYADGRIDADGTVVDCGAHIGLFTLYAAARCPRGRVVSVEPSPLNLEVLRRNVTENGLANVSIVPWALSGTAGPGAIHFTGEYATDYLLAPVIGEASAFTLPVARHTLDELFALQKIARCQLLKMDIEGSELEVLRASNLALDRTEQVLLELHKRVVSVAEMRTLLEAKGFRCKLFRESADAAHLYGARAG